MALYFDYRGIDTLVSSPVRLAILGLLFVEDQALFGDIRDVIKVSDGNLSVHLRKLQAARYVGIRHRGAGKRSRTMVTISAKGKRALLAHIHSLNELLDRVHH